MLGLASVGLACFFLSFFLPSTPTPTTKYRTPSIYNTTPHYAGTAIQSLCCLQLSAMKCPRRNLSPPTPHACHEGLALLPRRGDGFLILLLTKVFSCRQTIHAMRIVAVCEVEVQSQFRFSTCRLNPSPTITPLRRCPLSRKIPKTRNSNPKT
ncbi:MAG: hypothetical protein JWR35_3743 [Marmoricola sp.]|nr:hypothetical protein [Marmoricola sp.]